MKQVHYDRLSGRARAAAAVAAFVACTAVMSGVLGIFMSASGESFASLAGLRPAPAASAVLARGVRSAQRG